ELSSVNTKTISAFIVVCWFPPKTFNLFLNVQRERLRGQGNQKKKMLLLENRLMSVRPSF
ncbi:unnamed protein product, partial [Tenebrio molitor]